MTRSEMTPRHMERLWQRLSETFGAAFTTPYGHSPNQSWVDALRDISVDEVKRGLNSLFTWAEQFPPNAIQFRELCRPTSSPSHEAYRRIPVPAGDPDERKRIAMDAIQSLREGCLKPDDEPRRRVSAETRLLMTALDGDPQGLALARDMLHQETGCTCKQVGQRCACCDFLITGVKMPDGHVPRNAAG